MRFVHLASVLWLLGCVDLKRGSDQGTERSLPSFEGAMRTIGSSGSAGLDADAGLTVTGTGGLAQGATASGAPGRSGDSATEEGEPEEPEGRDDSAERNAGTDAGTDSGGSAGGGGQDSGGPADGGSGEDGGAQGGGSQEDEQEDGGVDSGAMPPSDATTEECGTPQLYGELGADPGGTLPTGSLAVLRSFEAPGTTSEGITHDGSSLWVSDNSAELFCVAPTGGLLGSLSSPEGTPQGMTWDGSELWLYTTNLSRVYELRVDGSQMTARFTAPTQVIGGGISNDLAWDGTHLWYANRYKVYRLNARGCVLGSFTSSRNVTGVDWDGEHLWVSYRSESFAGTELQVVDGQGKLLGRFDVAIYEVIAIAWGPGDRIWAVGRDSVVGRTRIYEIDASSATAIIP